jgi:chromosome segregation ATPase
MQKSKGQEPKVDAGSPQDKAVQEKLESLKGDYKELETKKIQTETNIKTLEAELKKLRKQAQESFGTSDLEELKKLLEKRRQENETLVAEYEQHIRGIKERLAEIETPPESETP